MINTSNIALFAILGSIGAFWAQIRGFIAKIFSFFIRTEEIESDWIGRHAFKIIAENSKIIRWGNLSWTGQYNQYIKKYNLFFQFFYRKENNVIFIYKKIPIIAKKTEKGLSITYFFTTFNFKKILEEAYRNAANEAGQFEKEKEITSFFISEFSGEDARINSGAGLTDAQPKAGQYGAPQNNDINFFHYEWLGKKAEYLGIHHSDIGEDKKKETETYYWSEGATKLKEEISFWKNNSKWFNDRGITHRRASLLIGPPGSGKSQMVLQVAKSLGVPIRKINPSNMSDKEFESYYNRGAEKCVVILIEDIDRIFEQNVNLLAKDSKTKNLLSFDTLLNTIGGIKRNDGIFLIVTVNDFSKCSDALVRPGRCDVKIEVGPLDKPGREFIAKNILKDWPDLIKSMVDECEGDVAATFENKCIERALLMFYQNHIIQH